MKKYDPGDLPVDRDLLEETPIHGEIDIESLAFRQMERTSFAATQSEELFAAAVRTLMNYLPTHRRQEVLDREDEYMSTQQRWVYKYCCGVPLGTPKEHVNNSPFLIEEQITDWYKLYEVILDVFEECGVTWKFEKWTIEAGKVEDSEKPTPMPTPVFAKEIDQQITQLTTTPTSKVPEKYKRPCAICGGHVGPGTGKIFKRRLVHKAECLGLAELKWKNGEE